MREPESPGGGWKNLLKAGRNRIDTKTFPVKTEKDGARSTGTLAGEGADLLP